jgi:hypothetical protein
MRNSVSFLTLTLSRCESEAAGRQARSPMSQHDSEAERA